RKLRLSAPVSLQAQERAIGRAGTGASVFVDRLPVDPSDFAPSEILAELVIEGPEVTDQDLPAPAELQAVVPRDLAEIKSEEIAATVQLDPTAPQNVFLQIMSHVSCSADDGKCTGPCTTGSPNCLSTAFTVDGHHFSPAFVRSLKLRTGGAPTA